MNKFEIDLVKDHVDDPTVREIFADGVRLVSCTDGAMILELTVRRPHLVQALPAVPKMRTHTVARIALTVPAGTQVMEQIRANLEQLAALRTSPPTPPAQAPRH